MASLALDLDTWTDRGCAIVELAGDLGAAGAPLLREELAAITARPLRLIVVVERVAFLDDTGLGVLLGAARRARDSGGGIALVGPRGQVCRTLETKALSAILRPCASIEEAIALLTGPATA